MRKIRMKTCADYGLYYRKLEKAAVDKKKKKVISKDEIYKILSHRYQSDIDEMLNFWISIDYLYDVKNGNVKFPTRKEINTKELKHRIEGLKKHLIIVKKEENEIKTEIKQCQNRLKKLS